MKYTPKFLLFLFLTNCMLAQSASTKLRGYWVSTTHYCDSSLLFSSDRIVQQSIAFKAAGRLQRDIVIHNQTTTAFDTLVYKSKYRRNFLTHELSFVPKNTILLNTGNYKAIDKFKSKIRALSDTSFVLLNNTFYKQADEPFVIDYPEPSPPHTLLIQSSLHPETSIKIPRRKLTLQIDETHFPGDHLSRINNAECLIDSIIGDSIKVTLLSEEIELEHRNRFSSVSTNYYAGSFNKVHKLIATKDIVSLTMKSANRHNMSQIGTVLMSAAVILIVASPFAGFQMNDANRANARNRVFTTGITCFGVSLPFFIAGRNKKYNISTAYPAKKDNYWTLLQH